MNGSLLFLRLSFLVRKKKKKKKFGIWGVPTSTNLCSPKHFLSIKTQSMHQENAWFIPVQATNLPPTGVLEVWQLIRKTVWCFVFCCYCFESVTPWHSLGLSSYNERSEEWSTSVTPAASPGRGDQPMHPGNSANTRWIEELAQKWRVCVLFWNVELFSQHLLDKIQPILLASFFVEKNENWC